MIKYVVKVVSTAKDSNPSFVGNVNIYYYGKDQYLLASKDRHADNLSYLNNMALSYGYNRECDAKKSYFYKTRNNFDEFWTNVTTIEKVDIY
jgi:hypothetical protein